MPRAIRRTADDAPPALPRQNSGGLPRQNSIRLALWLVRLPVLNAPLPFAYIAAARLTYASLSDRLVTPRTLLAGSHPSGSPRSRTFLNASLPPNQGASGAGHRTGRMDFLLAVPTKYFFIFQPLTRLFHESRSTAAGVPSDSRSAQAPEWLTNGSPRAALQHANGLRDSP